MSAGEHGRNGDGRSCLKAIGLMRASPRVAGSAGGRRQPSAVPPESDVVAPAR